MGIFAWARRVEQKIDGIARNVAVLVRQAAITIRTEVVMSDALNRLQKDVAANGDVVNSAAALINGISAELKAALSSSDPPAAIDALAQQLEQQSAALSAAVAANTPAAPPAPATPAPSDPPATPPSS